MKDDLANSNRIHSLLTRADATGRAHILRWNIATLRVRC